MNENKHFPMRLNLTKTILSVVGEFTSFKEFDYPIDQLEDGKGYINNLDHMVWVYKEYPPINDTVGTDTPLFWVADENGTIKHSHPNAIACRDFSDRFLEIASGDDIIDRICNNDDPQMSYREEAVDDLNINSDIAMPRFFLNDDFFKKIIKTIFHRIKVPLSQCKNAAFKQYTVNNMWNSLIAQNGKMSIKYFTQWLEIFGLKVTILIENDDRVENVPKRLKEPLVYYGEKNAVYNLSDLYGIYKFPEITPNEPDSDDDTSVDDEDDEPDTSFYS